MVGSYEVKLGGQNMGKVQVTQRGLYYRFVCRCSLPRDLIYRLVLRCGNQYVNIGVLIPDGDGCCLDKRHPVKIFSEEKPEFYVAPRHDDVGGKFVPISPEEPFLYISKLKNAFLASENGQLGACLTQDPDAVYDRL